MEYIPYTYLIGWKSLDKWYYGVEYSRIKKTANPSNLWNIYFSSSKIVSTFRELHGEPDIIEIRKIFDKGNDAYKMESAISWEKGVLRKIDITQEKWLNGRIGGDVCPISNKKIAILKYGVPNVFMSEEVKTKIRKTNLKRYGVEYPIQSPAILAKRQQNNIDKTGCASGLSKESKQMRSKTMEERYGARTVMQSPVLKAKMDAVILEKYGVKNVGASPIIKAKVKETRNKLSGRPIVSMIREIITKHKIKLGSGWYQSSDEKLERILKDLRKIYG